MRKQRPNQDTSLKEKRVSRNPFQLLRFLRYSNPSAVYLFFLFAVLYLGSPSPYVMTYTQTQLIFRFIVIIFMAGAWAFSQRHYQKEIVWTEFITFLIFGVVAYGISQALRGWGGFREEWWSIGWAILLFLCTNLIFTKNRQNIRDDLIAVQNYTFKRYLLSKEEK